MAFLINGSSANARHLGIGLHAEFTTWLASVSTTEVGGISDRKRLIGCTVNITDRTGQEMWYVTPTGFLPFKDPSLGTMSEFNLSVNGTAAAVANEETINFNDNAIFKFGFDVNAKAVTAKIQGTSANLGQVLTGDADGNAVFANLPLQDVGDTSTTHAFLDGGAVKVDAKLDTLSANNLLKVQGNGLRVDAMTVAQASQGLISIDPVTNELIVEKLLSGEVETSEAANLAAWATEVGYNSTTKNALLQTLDVLVLKDATTGVLMGMFVKTANTGVAATDLTEIPLHVVPAEVRAVLSANNGIFFNTATGNFSGVRDTVALRNDLTISSNGFLVNVETANMDCGLGNQTLIKNLIDIRGEAATNAGRADNMLSYDSTSNKIQAGGPTVKDTTFTANHNVLYDASSTGGYRFLTDNVQFKDHFKMSNAAGYVMVATLTSFNQMEWTLDPNS